MLRSLLILCYTTIAEFFSDRATQFAAALSFYAAFSLAPLLVMMLSVLALVLDGAAARDFIIDRISSDFGDEVAVTIAGMLERVDTVETSGLAALLASGAMLIGATAVIMSMKSALDHIFGGHDYVSARALWLSIIKARFKGFFMVLVLASLVAVSTVLTAIAGGLNRAIGARLPEWVDLAAWANTGIGLLLLTALFFIFYRFFPDRPPRRKPALLGALVGVGLFSLGKGIIGWYVAKVSGAWAFGAAGALAVVLFWIFMSANTVLLGAVCAKCINRDWRQIRDNEPDTLTS
ncbi:MAG: YihY/virulence factor BrkB family protein [Burkholderiaceae bacterium]